jgi:small subunit ribosomal protein S2
MARVPSAIWVVDTKKEHIAVSEARKLGIPVIAILDTNCDPDEVSYPIPGNDDAIRSVALLTRVVADAVADGLIARAGAAAGEEKPAVADGALGTTEPLAEWERELLVGNADAETTANGAAKATASNGAAPAPAAPATAEAATTEAAPVASQAATAEAAAAPAEAAAPPEPAPSDSGTQPRAGSAEAESSDPLAAEPDAIEPADEVPADEVPADEVPADEPASASTESAGAESA